MRKVLIRAMVTIAFPAALIGCGSNDRTAAPIVRNEPVPLPELPPLPVEVSTSEAAPPEPIVEVDYTPPFPDRVNPFSPGKESRVASRSDDVEALESVELKGFVSLDKPWVVLSIEGITMPMAAGQSKYGVQVVSVTPPSVVLQRGNNRWTEKLE